MIRRAREARGWSLEELGRLAGGLNKETVMRVELGGNTTMDTLRRLARALDMHLGDLFGISYLGKRDDVTSPVSLVREVQEAGDDERLDVSGYERFSIPVIAEGDASPEGTFWNDEGVKLIEAEEWMSRPNDPAVKDPRCYGVKVRGDSMEPLLEAGMRVIVSPNLTIVGKGLGYVQLRSGERLIKMVHAQPGGYTLESFNRAYAPRFVARDDVDAVHRIAYIRTLK